MAYARRGLTVALLDTDPQGSLGRWFMARRDRLGDAGMDFTTSSAWGVSYECEKLRRVADVILIDTPPKVDADLRPALREADLVLVPVASSHVDLWATEGVLDLARREGKPATVVLNRMRAGTRLSEDVAAAAAALDATVAGTRIANRNLYAETLGQGLGIADVQRRGAAADEIATLADEVARLADG